MQVKVVIGTVAFMLTMIILGYAALREPARLEDAAGAYKGRSIETGGMIFDSNCATCHGVDGKAQAGCTNPLTGDATCVGLPLNNYFLLCGDRPQRLVDLGWQGTVENYILKTVSAGRGEIMPAWSNRYGGSMRDDQIQNVTLFVMNWGDAEFCAIEPSQLEWPESVHVYQGEGFPEEDPPIVIEPGNPEDGALAYQTYGCSGCHGMPEESGTASQGPWLGEIETEGATRIEGMEVQEYIYHSILDPSAFIAPECPNGACTDGIMPKDFATRMSNSPQDMANILSYLMGDAYEYP